MDTQYNNVQIQKSLITFVIRNFIVEEEEINLEESIIDQGIIDSFGIVEIISFIENEYKVKVPEEHLNRKNFGSIIKMVDYIDKRLKGIAVD